MPLKPPPGCSLHAELKQIPCSPGLSKFQKQTNKSHSNSYGKVIGHLVGHLQRLASLDEDAVLGGHPSAHHDGRGRGQAQGAGAGDAEHRDGRLERKADDHLCLGDMLVGGLKNRYGQAEGYMGNPADSESHQNISVQTVGPAAA